MRSIEIFLRLTATTTVMMSSFLSHSHCAASPLDDLRAWQQNSDLGALNRVAVEAISPARRVILVIGATGAGKSSTANTLAGRLHARFETSAAIASHTRASSHRDYEFLKTRWRVIDTPGLGDTNRSPDDVLNELRAVSALAPHGISAVIIALPHGRYSNAQDAALRDVTEILGGPACRVADFTILGFTSAVTSVAEGRALMTRAAILAEIACLPLDSFLRAFASATHDRVVAIENMTEPHRWSSRMALHQRVIVIEDANGGERFDITAAFTSSVRMSRAGQQDDGLAVKEEERRERRSALPCDSKFLWRDGKKFIVVECEVQDTAL